MYFKLSFYLEYVDRDVSYSFFKYIDMNLKHLSAYTIMIHQKILHVQCDYFSKFNVLLTSDLFYGLCMNCAFLFIAFKM